MPTTEYGVDEFFQNAGTSPKLVYDVAGTLGWSPHNTVLQSQTFTDASWFKQVTTATSAAIIAPDGTMTGTKLAVTSTGLGFYALLYNFSAVPTIVGETYTSSIYVKAAELSWISLTEGNNDLPAEKSFFNLATGALGTKAAAHTRAVIESVGNGWYRCSITFVATVSGYYPKFHLQSADSQASWFPGAVGDGVYFWGAQLNRGSVPTTYVSTTTAARFGLALDHDPVTQVPKGLLCEPQATNQMPRSNSFSVGWTTSGFTVAQNATGPLGANTAWTFTASAGATGKWTYIDFFGGASAHRYSVYAKAGTINWIAMGDGSGGAANAAFFNVSAGTVGTVAGRFSAGAIEAVGNGWYRCSATVTGSLGYIDVQPHSADNQAISWTATGGETVFVSAAQAEAGAVATSYIPTTNATVTRAGDVVSVTSASINYSATAGSWWADVDLKTAALGNRIIGRQDSFAPLYVISSTTFGYYDVQANFGKVVSSAVGSNKVASAFQSADRAITANGLAAVTDTTVGASFSPGTAIGFGCYPSAGTDQINGYIRKVRYVPRRMSNAELQTMTA